MLILDTRDGRRRIEFDCRGDVSTMSIFFSFELRTSYNYNYLTHIGTIHILIYNSVTAWNRKWFSYTTLTREFKRHK